jgi:transposase
VAAITELPNDIEKLKAILTERERLLAERDSIIRQITAKLSWAEEKIRALELRYFGRKSEKYSPEEDKQNRLFDEAEAHADEAAPPVVETVAVQSHQRKKRGRKPKADNLPVREEIHKLPAADRVCPCCGEARPEIGEERSAEYDLVPAHVVKIVHVRKKYGPCSCEAFRSTGKTEVIAAPGPAKIVPGSDFTNRTIAFFLTAKYQDAIPFYRMERMLRRSGLVVSRAGLCKLAVSVGRALGDLTEMMNRDIARSPVMLMDETTVQVLKEGTDPPEKKSYMWTAVGFLDGKPIHRFAYHHNREGSFADELLKGFSGYIQTDGYSGYDHLAGREKLVHVGCFAHIRRKFVEAWETAGKTGVAKEAIDLIAKIYAVESNLRGKLESEKIKADEFKALRAVAMAPLFEALRAWLMTKAYAVVPQSKLGMAISYAQNVFERAIRFVDHPLLTPDTNRVENAIRPFVVGRKNWLFSGSPGGAHTSAGLYSLIETAKANGHEPYAYLCHLFDALPTCKTDADRKALLPYRLDPSIYKVNAV